MKKLTLLMLLSLLLVGCGMNPEKAIIGEWEGKQAYYQGQKEKDPECFSEYKKISFKDGQMDMSGFRYNYEIEKQEKKLILTRVHPTYSDSKKFVIEFKDKNTMIMGEIDDPNTCEMTKK